ncbi:hypothetical protein GEMRC1_008800 [Eukaryota sp. GEM-RC1]
MMSLEEAIQRESKQSSCLTPPFKLSKSLELPYILHDQSHKIWFISIKTNPNVELNQNLSWAADILSKAMKKNLGKKRLNSKEKSSIDLQISEAPSLQQLISEAEQFLDASEVAELKKKHFERSPEPVFEKDEITIIAIHTFCLNQNTFEPSDSCLLTTYSVNRLDNITPIQFEGEFDMLNAFWSYLGEDLPIFFVGHNALTFDMPSLMKRFLHYQPNFNFSAYINQRFADIPFFIFQQLSKCEKVFNIFDTHSVASKFYNCGGRNSLEILVTQLLRLNYNHVIIESYHDQQLILQCCHENSMTSELFRYFLDPKIQHLLELSHYKIIKCGLENFVNPIKLKMEIETIVFDVDLIVRRTYLLLKFFLLQNLKIVERRLKSSSQRKLCVRQSGSQLCLRNNLRDFLQKTESLTFKNLYHLILEERKH